MIRCAPAGQPPLALTAVVAAFLLTPVATLAADPHGLTGDWKTTDGSVVRLAPCSNALCLRVVSISPTAPGTVDEKNPDASLRKRSVCNLEIGSGFSPEGANASGGRIYDPMSGKTYKANLKLTNPDTLELRGYVGLPAFGRTETWHRTSLSHPCS